MYEYLIGFVTGINSDCIVLEVNGVGYRLYVANSDKYEINTNKRIKIYVYQVVTDSYQALYGFLAKVGKVIFEKLLNVSGIGPKSALAILSGNNYPTLIQAINEEDVKFLVKFPGVGKKTAKQIILDLKDKFDLANMFEFMGTDSYKEDKGINQSKFNSQALKDALAALQTLGYSRIEISKVEKELLKIKNKLNTDEYLSRGLKLLST